MKLLLVHNFYGSTAPSGENTVYLAERQLLLRNGHEVFEFTRHSDEIRNKGITGVIKGAIATPLNPFAATKLRRLLEQEQPDIMHVHNTFPLLSPAIFHAAAGLSTATVLTLHNYRTFCAAGIPERNGLPCTECLDRRSVIPALRYGCYRKSRTASVPMAAMIALHRCLGTWERHVDAFIALTEFQKEKLIAAGLPGEKMHVKPHFYDAPPSPLPWPERKERVVYIGRLGEYKGVHVLIDAWQKWGNSAPELEIIGDGPELRRLESLAEGNPQIRFSGQLPFPETQARLAGSRLLILPSLCFEGFPMVIREAFALGVPVAGSRLGSIPCIVQEGKTGTLFLPGNAEDLLVKVKALWEKGDRIRVMGEAARQEFEVKYTAEANYRMMMEIYEKAIGNRR